MPASDNESSPRRHLVAGGFALGLSFAETAASPTTTNLNTETGQLNAAAQQANGAFFPGFKQQFIKTSGAVINMLVCGEGLPLVLLHGYPETHVEWHRVAPQVVERFTVVMTDLRGYGDSGKPDGGENYINYARRVMRMDQIKVMTALGFQCFQAGGHDGGARVLHVEQQSP
jgi:haloacetate dehalogenase